MLVELWESIDTRSTPQTGLPLPENFMLRERDAKRTGRTPTDDAVSGSVR